MAYLGRSSNDAGNGIAVDAASSVYVTDGPFDLVGATAAEPVFQRWQRTETNADYFKTNSGVLPADRVLRKQVSDTERR